MQCARSARAVRAHWARRKISFTCLCGSQEPKRWVHISMIQHAQVIEFAVSCGCTRQHAIARCCRAPLYLPRWPPFGFSPILETEFFLWLELAVGAMCLWQTLVSSQCVRSTITRMVAIILCVSPSLEPSTLAFTWWWAVWICFKFESVYHKSNSARGARNNDIEISNMWIL